MNIKYHENLLCTYRIQKYTTHDELGTYDAEAIKVISVSFDPVTFYLWVGFYHLLRSNYMTILGFFLHIWYFLADIMSFFDRIGIQDMSLYKWGFIVLKADYMQLRHCHRIHKDKAIIESLRQERFDVAIADFPWNECGTALAARLGK